MYELAVVVIAWCVLAGFVIKTLIQDEMDRIEIERKAHYEKISARRGEASQPRH